jgi:putative methyltransferase
MTRSGRLDQKNILISIPGKSGQLVYLPTVWANLKTYCRRSATIEQSYRWLDPIIDKGSPEQLLTSYGSDRIDVLGISCYCWNSETNFALAREVRRRFPDCLVIAGGPDPDYQNTDFFADHPYIDAIVVQDGEIAFGRILDCFARDGRDFADITGLILPSRAPDGPRFRATGPQDLPTEFAESPWLTNRDYFEPAISQLKAQHADGSIIISWETDRGCPYKCTFCDWGSNTYAKVRRLPIDRLREEAMWIGQQKIDIVSFTAANFGILPQDSVIVDHLIEANRRYGYPKNLQWNNAKNNTDRVIEISAKAYAAGMIDFHVLSIQSLDADVLAAMSRVNIGEQRQRHLVDTLRQKGMPNVVQLIYGGPADNLERFSRTLTGLMEWGIHDEYVTYPFMVLPNAPANDPDYRKTWQIETVSRYSTISKRDRRDPLAEGDDRSMFVVSTSSFDRDEYIEIYLFGRLMIALHNGGCTQFIARYLRQTHGVSYFDFYHAVVKGLFRQGGTAWNAMYRRAAAHLLAFFKEGGRSRFEQIELDELPELTHLVDIEDYFLISLMTDIDTFYADLVRLIGARFGDLQILPSLIGYQRGLMIDPSYDRRIGRWLGLQHDWPTYFDERNRTADALPEPSSLRTEMPLLIDRTHSGVHGHYALDWHERAAGSRDVLLRWIEAIVGPEYTRARRSYFHAIEHPTARSAAMVAAGWASGSMAIG